MIDDHINLLYGNPLSGKNYDELGERFPDMSEPYSSQLKNLLQQKASELNIELKKGIYVAVNGPNLETKAEYRYLKITTSARKYLDNGVYQCREYSTAYGQCTI